MKWDIVIVIGIFQVTQDAEHLFICSLDISASCIMTHIHSSFVIIELLSYREFISILDPSPMSNTCIGNSFSQLVP